jgi:hypothetical protein
MVIIHGENVTHSRNKLLEIIEKAKENEVIIERLYAKEIDVAILEEKLQKSDLFGHSRMLVVEELHSLPKSSKLTKMIELLISSEMEICLWEKRQLTATMLKKFSNATIHEFKLANSLFKWLDSLSPIASSKTTQLKLFQQAIIENDEYLCFVMLIRQVRMMIQALDGGEIKGPGFVINKIRSQANQFNLQSLIKLHQHLFELDKKIKSSQNHLSLNQELEQLIIHL